MGEWQSIRRAEDDKIAALGRALVWGRLRYEPRPGRPAFTPFWTEWQAFVAAHWPQLGPAYIGSNWRPAIKPEAEEGYVADVQVTHWQPLQEAPECAPVGDEDLSHLEVFARSCGDAGVETSFRLRSVDGISIDNPGFDDPNRINDWRGHVGGQTAAIWDTLTTRQRRAIVMDANFRASWER